MTWSKIRGFLGADKALRILLVASASTAASGCFISFPDYAEGNINGTGGNKTTVDAGNVGGSRSAGGAGAGGASATPDASVAGSSGAGGGGAGSGGVGGAAARKRKP